MRAVCLDPRRTLMSGMLMAYQVTKLIMMAMHIHQAYI